MALLVPILTAGLGSVAINLSWTPADVGPVHATYHLFRSATGGAPWVEIGVLDDESFDDDIQPAGMYWYYVEAINDADPTDIALSTPVSVVVPPTGQIDGFKFTFLVGDARVDADSVVFSDVTGLRGVWDKDSGQEYIAAGTAMVRTGLGIYTYSVVGPTQDSVKDRTLEWFAKVMYQGNVYYFFRQTRNGVTLPVSAFIDFDQFVKRWGFGNIAIASNKDNVTKTPDYDAVQDAFDYATDEVNSSQKGGRYAVPLDFSQNGLGVPRKVRNWAMVIAFEYLYNGRGLDDKNKVGNKITKQLSDVYMEMSLYHSGVRHLEAALASDTVGNLVTEQVSGFVGAVRLRPWYWIGGIPVFSGVYLYA